MISLNKGPQGRAQIGSVVKHHFTRIIFGAPEGLESKTLKTFAVENGDLVLHTSINQVVIPRVPCEDPRPPSPQGCHRGIEVDIL